MKFELFDDALVVACTGVLVCDYCCVRISMCTANSYQEWLGDSAVWHIRHIVLYKTPG